MFKKLLKTLDKIFLESLPLTLVIALLVLLRIPNFFEPYWYGDEAIYLTVGAGIRNGLRLYTEIIDHKTPIIYYLATVPNQFYFRALTLGWMITATFFFHKLCQKLFANKKGPILATVLMVLATTLPWFEGNIPNGELFVIGFVMVGAYFFTRTKLFDQLIESKQAVRKKLFAVEKYELKWLFGAGVLMGLGILTKIPALFDLAAFLAVGWFIITNQLLTNFRKESLWKIVLPTTIFRLLILGLGVLAPIALSIIYYISVGSGQDYLEYGLLYNIRYSGSWQHNFASPILQFLVTLKGKLILLSGVMLLLTLAKKVLNPTFQFMAAWFGLALFAALLSNRPYPHYFLQIFPAMALMLSWVIIRLTSAFKTLLTASTKSSQKRPNLGIMTVETTLAVGLMAAFVALLFTFDVGLYPTRSYYQNFKRYLTQNMSQQEYYQSFNGLMTENYQVAKLIKEMNLDRIFIWGTNPMLYTLSDTIPTARFTVSFHIIEFNAYQETFNLITQHQPKLIIVMNNETQPFPELKTYLQQQYSKDAGPVYLPNSSLQHMTIYLRRNQVD